MNWLPRDDDNTAYMLHFGVLERQRIALGSDLYTTLSHHVSRQFTGADKLVVSTMAAVHYLLKFHRTAFSRHHLFRMMEMLSSYSPPELNSIFETTITQALWPYLRLIRNGLFRFRFYNWIEQEIRYICRVNDLESASFTFSLDAINDIKAHYRKSLAGVTNTYETLKTCAGERGPCLVAELNIVLGDIYFAERAYDEAVVYYQTAVNAHLEGDGITHIECLFRYVEALLKLGNVQEHRQRYDRATMNYHRAGELVDGFLGKGSVADYQSRVVLVRYGYWNKRSSERLRDGDSKWVLLKQPYWAELFLDLKRGNQPCINVPLPNNLYGPKDPYGPYRQGQLYFYRHEHHKAAFAFFQTIQICHGSNFNEDSEDRAYVIGNACIYLAENFLVDAMRDIKREISEISDANNLVKELCRNFIDLLESTNTTNGASGNPFEFANYIDSKWEKVSKLNKQTSQSSERQNAMLVVLGSIFYAAEQFEKHKLYEDAAMAYIKAIGLWTAVIGMLPLPKLKQVDQKQCDKLKEIVNDGMKQWFRKACDKAKQNIQASNGQSHRQLVEEWLHNDVPDLREKLSEQGELYVKSNKNQLIQLKDSSERNKLSKQIEFWQNSLLGQQLVSLTNWACTVVNVLRDQVPVPLKQYRLPLYSTRSLIFSAWNNARDQLGQAEYVQNILMSPNSGKCENYPEFVNSLIEKLKSEQDNSGTNSKEPGAEDCYYLLAAKSLQNLYQALHYSRILTDNNQSLMFPPTTAIQIHLWRLLYGLVDFEARKKDPKCPWEHYQYAQNRVRNRLRSRVSKDVPLSHLDFGYVANRAIHQLREYGTMGDASATTRVNILKNKYYLNDDFEDPGFRLDWTMIQMTIPSSVVLIELTAEDTARLQGDGRKGDRRMMKDRRTNVIAINFTDRRKRKKDRRDSDRRAA